MLNRARNLDPYSRVLSMSAGANLFYLRRYDEAFERLDEVIESNPDFAAAYFWKSLVLIELHRVRDAIEEGKKALELDNGSAPAKLNLALIYARSGDVESAIRLMNEAVSDQKGYVQPGSLALVKLALGQKDEAFALLEKAVQVRDTTVLYLRGTPSFVEYRSDPRWLEIEKKIGLPKS